MSKKKSPGQQMYEMLRNTAHPMNWGEKFPSWEDSFECVQELYEKAAKRLHKKWSREAINEYRKNCK